MKLLKYISYFFITVLLLVFLAIFWRVVVADRFVIPSDSMAPVLRTGDRIRVNKLIYGARIYKDYDFYNGMELKCFRMPGLRGIRRNDILVFNFPVNDGRISFIINYVFAKRCIGLPGDKVSIVDGIYKNDHCPFALGDIEVQERLKTMALEEINQDVRNVIQPGVSMDTLWTMKDFGPVYVPAKGDTIRIDDTNRVLYGALITYEGGSIRDSVHVFTHDYYFMAGDYVLDSQDSRYWGLLPDDYIVGVVKTVLFNRNPQDGKINFTRHKRL